MVGCEPALHRMHAKRMESLMEDENLVSVSSLFSRPLNANLSSPLIRSCHLKEIDDGYGDHLTIPLIQVVSVCVFSNFDDGIPCEVYGSIRVLEGTNPCFYLYDREPKESEITGKDHMLSLIGTNVGAIRPSVNTRLDLCLKDKNRGVEIVSKMLPFDDVVQGSYVKRVFEGAHGYAIVTYVAFPFAINCTVKVTVAQNDYVNRNIYGSIVARYENERMSYDLDEPLHRLEMRLFEKPPDQPLCVLPETPVKLSRNVVIVPPYSSVNIKLNLWCSSGKIADCCLNFPVSLHDRGPLKIRTQYGCVGVHLERPLDCSVHPHNRDLFSESSIDMQKKVENSTSMVLFDPHPSSSTISTDPPFYVSGRSKVEVFTVVVGGITRNITALSGAILINDGADIFSIYNKDDGGLELLADNNLASIEVNYRAIINTEFGVLLYLRDPVSNLEVCRGTFGWNVFRLQHESTWYTKRLCTVVRGDDGYAAVHYEIFDNAYEAHVKVKLCTDGNEDIPTNLYGTLLGRYSGYNYSTHYEKEYFTSRLFDRPRDRPMELGDVQARSKVALLKSIVVVPHNALLIMEADLGAFDTDNVEPILGTAEFMIDFRGTGIVTKTIGEGHTWIEVEVCFYDCKWPAEWNSWAQKS